MVKRIVSFMLVMMLLSLGSVLAQDVRYNYDQQADFSKYKTYRWEQHPESIQVDSLVLGQLGQGFDAELAKKGLVKKEGAADLVIVYQLAYREEKQVSTYNSGWNSGPYWGRRWYGSVGGGYSETSVSTIPIGSISLDFFDAGNKTLVWGGQATKTIDVNAKPEKQMKNIAKAAQKLLKNYPPKKGK